MSVRRCRAARCKRTSSGKSRMPTWPGSCGTATTRSRSSQAARWLLCQKDIGLRPSGSTAPAGARPHRYIPGPPYLRAAGWGGGGPPYFTATGGGGPPYLVACAASDVAPGVEVAAWAVVPGAAGVAVGVAEAGELCASADGPGVCSSGLGGGPPYLTASVSGGGGPPYLTAVQAVVTTEMTPVAATHKAAPAESRLP